MLRPYRSCVRRAASCACGCAHECEMAREPAYDEDHAPPSLLPDIITFFFFNDTATTEIYTLSLHDALPICVALVVAHRHPPGRRALRDRRQVEGRSEEHTSELQSQSNLVCRLLLEKKTTTKFATLHGEAEDTVSAYANPQAVTRVLAE